MPFLLFGSRQPKPVYYAFQRLCYGYDLTYGFGCKSLWMPKASWDIIKVKSICRVQKNFGFYVQQTSNPEAKTWIFLLQKSSAGLLWASNWHKKGLPLRVCCRGGESCGFIRLQLLIKGISHERGWQFTRWIQAQTTHLSPVGFMSNDNSIAWHKCIAWCMAWVSRWGWVGLRNGKNEGAEWASWDGSSVKKKKKS